MFICKLAVGTYAFLLNTQNSLNIQDLFTFTMFPFKYKYNRNIVK